MDFMDLDSRLTLDWSAPTDAPRWKKHLYQDAKGNVPEKLNTWEAAVLNEEIARGDFVGWLRNRERQPWAPSIPYDAAGIWKACYPDFIVFRKKDGETIADIVDPHLISLEDAPRKAAALAKFADEHQGRLGRVDLVIVDRQGSEERIKRLRLMDDSTRQKVMGVTTSQHLRDLFELKN